MKRGYTVIELLVVLAIITIVLGIVVPRLNRSSTGTQLKTTVDSITGFLETARSIATSQHTTCELIHDAGESKIYMKRKDIDDVDHDDDRDEMIQIDRGLDIPQGITVYFTADDTVKFNSAGGVDNPDDSITVSAVSINKHRTITVNTITGYIHVS